MRVNAALGRKTAVAATGVVAVLTALLIAAPAEAATPQTQAKAATTAVHTTAHPFRQDTCALTRMGTVVCW
jgi:hypothetical protein